MKVLMVAAAYPPDVRGGGEFSTQFLAEALTAANVEVVVLAASSAESRREINRVEVRRCKSPNWPWNFERNRSRLDKLLWHVRENWNPRAVKLVSKVIRETKPDLLLSSTVENFGGSAWLAAAAERVKCIHILRSYFPICWQGSLFKNGGNCSRCCAECKIFSIGRRLASNHVDGVIGISNYVLSRHLEENVFKRAKPTVLQDPIPPHYFGQSRAGRRKIPTFGFLGMLTPNKGVELLAAAWKEVGQADAKLILGGTGDPRYVTTLRDLMPPGPEFLGWVTAPEFLDAVDFLVVPSVWHEPFGRIVVEAYARGVPVLGSRIGGIAEMIEDGRTGFLFESGSSASLAVIIRRALELSTTQFVEMSRTCLLEARKYHASQIGQRHVKFFCEVIAG